MARLGSLAEGFQVGADSGRADTPITEHGHANCADVDDADVLNRVLSAGEVKAPFWSESKPHPPDAKISTA